jgi:hypothetical protein
MSGQPDENSPPWLQDLEDYSGELLFGPWHEDLDSSDDGVENSEDSDFEIDWDPDGM